MPDNYRFTDRTLYYRNIDLLHSNTINKFSYLADISYKKNDGYAQQNNYEFISGLGKFTYDLFSNRDLELTLQYTNSNSGYPHYWKKDGTEIQPYKIQDFYLGDKITKETQSIDINYYAIPSSKIRYDIPNFSQVKLTVFDITGKIVATLVNQQQSAGHYEILFDGAGLSSGIYFYRLETSTFTDTKKMTLIK